MGSDLWSGIVVGGLALISALSVAAMSRGGARMRWRRAFLEWADLHAKLPADSTVRNELRDFLDDGTHEILKQSRAAMEDEPAFPSLATRPLLVSWSISVIVVTLGFSYVAAQSNIAWWQALIVGAGLVSASNLVAWLLVGSTKHDVASLKSLVLRRSPPKPDANGN